MEDIAPEDLIIIAFGIITGCFLVLSLILHALHRLCFAPHPQQVQDIQLKRKESDVDKDMQLEYQSVGVVIKGKIISKKTVKRIEYASIIVCTVFFQLFLIACVTYNRLHMAGGIILMFFTSAFVFMCFVPPYRLAKPPNKITLRRIPRLFYNKVQQSPKIVISGLVAILCVVLALNIGLEGSCSYQARIVNTRISRSFMEPTCTAGRPCYVYLTLPRYPSTAMIVNYHTTPPGKGPKKGRVPPTTTVKFDTVSRLAGGQYAYTAEGSVYRMPNLEVERDVHWTHLTSLSPNTTYYFIAGPGYDNAGNEVWSEEYKFRTLVDDNSSYSFMAGGDMGNSSKVATLTSIAASQEPSFALLGGDLAYEDGHAQCYRIVDTWLGNWMSRMITPAGYMVPFVSAIGNHEVYAGYKAKPNKVPFYIRYFPHMDQSEDPGEDVDARKTYHEHYVGNSTVIIALDSGHVLSPSGTQAAWLDEVLSQNQAKTNIFVTYHVPMYPTYRAYDTPHSVQVRNAWLSTFDKYGVDVSFENHDHAYKRTKLLRGGKEDPSGTLYVGDGCWGKSVRALPSNTLRWYQNVAKDEQYVLRVDVNTNHSIHFEAFNTDDVVFDSFDLVK